MNFARLLEYLELEEASQFVYFENLADLVEADAEVSPEAIYQLFDGADMETLASLIDNYFEELLEAMPDDAVEMFTLLDTVKMALVGMARHIEEENDLVLLSDEFYRFRNWYSLDSLVWVHEIAKDNRYAKDLPIRDALTLSRLEKLGGTKFEYRFDEATDFEMDQYTMSFADLAAKDKLELQEEYSDDVYAYIDGEISAEDLH